MHQPKQDRYSIQTGPHFTANCVFGKAMLKTYAEKVWLQIGILSQQTGIFSQQSGKISQQTGKVSQHQFDVK